MNRKVILMVILMVLCVNLFNSCARLGNSRITEQGSGENTSDTIQIASNDLEEYTDPPEITDNELNNRIKTFISTVFKEPKIVWFDNFDDMSEELREFIFFMGTVKGIVYQYPTEIGEGLTKEMIEANIRALFGDDVISKLDFNYIASDYYEEYGTYMFVGGAAWRPVTYVFFSIENIQGNIYKALVSYIDNNADLLAYDALTGEMVYPPDYIRELQDENRTQAQDEFKKEIYNNPEKYERTELYLEVGEDYIHLLSASKYTD